MNTEYDGIIELMKLNNTLGNLFLIDLRDSDLPKTIVSLNIFDEDIEDSIGQVKEFFKENFQNLKKRVNFIDMTIDEFKTQEKQVVSKKKNYYNIPVYIDRFTDTSYVFSYKEEDEQFFVEGITIAADNISPLKSSYGHELTHVLTRRNQNIFNNYFDLEFLSIFIEKILIKEDSEEFKINEFNRLSLIKIHNEMGFDDYKDVVEFQKYYTSILKANYLYYLYRNMNIEQKIKLFKNLTKIFNGQITMDKFLKIYNIDLNELKIFEIFHESIQNSYEYSKTL